MGQDSADSGVDVEVVVGGDSEVPHPAGTLAGSVAARDNSGCAAGGAEVVAGVEVSGFHPLAGGGVPEQVAGGGVDDRGAVACLDRQVIEARVVVDEDGGDCLGLGLACLDVGGQDFVAGLEGGDGDRGAGG